MGQYHKLICATAGTALRASSLNCDSKAIAQIDSDPILASLALLLAGELGDHPRDLPWAPTGIWGGHAPVMIGDYAEDTDMIDRDDILPGGEISLYENSGMKKGPVKAGRRTKTPKCVGEALKPILERALSLRFTDMDIDGRVDETDGYLVHVAPSSAHPSGWDRRTEGLTPEYNKMCDFLHENDAHIIRGDWRRPPARMSGAPDNVPSVGEAGAGDKLIWVNLDRQEFIDPQPLGDTPDLAGVMCGISSKAVLSMLFMDEQRGGGDIHHCGPIYITGRWRGDRIVLMGTKGFKPKGEPRISHSYVQENFTDITSTVRPSVMTEEIFGTTMIEKKGETTDIGAPTCLESEIIGAVICSPQISNRFKVDGRDAIDDILLIITPPVCISRVGNKLLNKPVITAGRVEVYHPEGGKIWLPAATQRRINAAMAQMPVVDIEIQKTGVQENVGIQVETMRKIRIHSLSNHALFGLMAMP